MGVVAKQIFRLIFKILLATALLSKDYYPNKAFVNDVVSYSGDHYAFQKLCKVSVIGFNILLIFCSQIRSWFT